MTSANNNTKIIGAFLLMGLVILVFAWKTLYAAESQQLILIKAVTDNQLVTLKDGTQIALAKESTVRYLPFNSAIREVHISGEAVVRITNDKRPFIIRTVQGDIVTNDADFRLMSGLRAKQFVLKMERGEVELRPIDKNLVPTQRMTTDQQIDFEHLIMNPNIPKPIYWLWYLDK